MHKYIRNKITIFSIFSICALFLIIFLSKNLLLDISSKSYANENNTKHATILFTEDIHDFFTEETYYKDRQIQKRGNSAKLATLLKK